MSFFYSNQVPFSIHVLCRAGPAPTVLHVFANTHKFVRQVTIQRISKAPLRPSQQIHSTRIVQNSFLDTPYLKNSMRSTIDQHP